MKTESTVYEQSTVYEPRQDRERAEARADLADEMDLRRRELDLRSRELDIREALGSRELDIREREGYRTRT